LLLRRPHKTRPSRTTVQSKTKKKKRKKRRFVFSRILDGRLGEATEEVAGHPGASKPNQAIGNSSSSEDGQKATGEKAKKKKKLKKAKKLDEDSTTWKAEVKETAAASEKRVELRGDKELDRRETTHVADSSHAVVDTRHLTEDVKIPSSVAANEDKIRETEERHQQQQQQQQSSSANIPSCACSTAGLTTADSFRSGSSQPEVVFRQVDCVVTKTGNGDDDDNCHGIVLTERELASSSQQLHCSIQRGPELQRKPEAASKPELSRRCDDDDRSLSPVFSDSNSPPTRLLGSGGLQSPPLPPRNYGKNIDAGYLADVHGSLPVLTAATVTATSTVSNRKLLTIGVNGNGAARRGAEATVTGSVLLPKSVSLQGNQLLFPSATAAAAAVNHPKRRHHADGDGVIGRRTLSRLDVEHINRSQIFKMIAGKHSVMSFQRVRR
jgi:hypothetical protein